MGEAPLDVLSGGGGADVDDDDDDDEQIILPNEAHMIECGSGRQDGL